MPKRLAIVGILLESNAFAPPTGEEDFTSRLYLEGEELARLARTSGMLEFGPRLSAALEWEPVPILLTVAESGGPLDHAVFERFLSRIVERLEAAGPVDGVFIFGHGAGTTTRIDDMDGAYFAAIRDVVGPDVPIVAELDYHANISDLMHRSADMLIGYRTNPHVDVASRSREAAEALIRIFNGAKPYTALRRLPLVTPQVTQLTDPGNVMADLMAESEAAMVGPVANVSLYPGFAFSDTPYNGFAIVVTSFDDPDAAEELADRLAEKVWANRHRFRRDLVTIADAVAKAHEAVAGAPILLADIADNPGGGGRGNTVHILKALLQAGIDGVQICPFFEPHIVAKAHLAGEGTILRATINAEEPQGLSGMLPVDMRIERLTDGRFVDDAGAALGLETNLGPSCLVDVAGIKVAMTTYRHQTMSAAYFRHFGLRPEEARVLVVKSRGHFRAGFKEVVPDDRIFEVDAPGLTTAHLGSVPWKRLPRPVYPIDPTASYRPSRLSTRPIARA